MRRALVALALTLACAACPRPLTGGPAGAGGPTAVPPDASAVLTARTLGGLRELMEEWLPALGGASGPFAGLASALRSTIGTQPLSPAAAQLAGLDLSRPAHVSWRPTGDIVIALPASSAARAEEALARWMKARDAREVPAGAGARVFVDDEGTALVAAASPDALLLAPRPVDALGVAALLGQMARGQAPPPTGVSPAEEDAPLAFRATAAGLERALPGAGELLPGEELVRATATLAPEAGGLALAIDVEHERQERPARGEPPAGFCALPPGALLAARFPSSWVARDDGGPGVHLRGEIALAIFAPPVAEGAPRWVALSRPRDAAAAEALRGQLAVEGAVVEGGELGGHAVQRVRAGDGGDRVMVSAVEDELFVLASGEPPELRAALEGRATCVDPGLTKPDVWASFSPAKLARAVNGAEKSQGARAGDPVMALARVASRLDVGAERVEVRATLGERRSRVALRLRLAR